MGITLNDAQLDDVLDALDDAGEYRLAAITACDRCGADLCADHRADVQKTIRYAKTARQLMTDAR